MREMRHSALRSRNTERQLEQTVSDYEILGFDRNGRDQQHNHRIGIHHAESEQHAEYGTRCTDGHHIGPGCDHTLHIGGHRTHLMCRSLQPADLDPAHAHLQQTRTDTGNHIIDQETLAAHVVFERAPEHPQREHIHEQVRDAAVQEHVRNELVEPEIRALPRIEAQFVD